VFEKAEEMFGGDIGFRQTGYVVGVGAPNVDSLRKSLAAQRAVGVQTEEIDHSDVAEMWPFADLTPFAAFGWESRGGYGDAYQTAQAFAVSARAAGVRIRQGTSVLGLLVDGDRVTGVRVADGSEVSAGTVVVATGVWTKPFLAPYGIEVPIRVVREQIVTIAPGVETGAIPVFSDLVSLQYVRPEVGGDILFGNSDLADVEDADPDNYLNRATEAFVDLTVEKVGTRFPGFSAAAIRASYAGCYDVTPDWNPVISQAPLDGLFVAAGFSGHGFKISPAVGRLVADLVIDGRSADPRIPETDFRLARFAENKLLKTPYPYVGAGQMR
jgi:sarcosine oxidase subunit beta